MPARHLHDEEWCSGHTKRGTRCNLNRPESGSELGLPARQRPKAFSKSGIGVAQEEQYI